MDEYEIIAEQIISHKIRSAWHEMSRVHNEFSNAYNTTFTSASTLMAIYEEEGTPVTKIAPRMGMEPNSLSRVLKSMEKDQLIIRIPDSLDKRKVLVKLTEKGQNLRKIFLKAIFRLNNTLLKNIDPIKAKHFFEVINLVPKLTTNTVKEMLNEIEESD